MVVIIRRRIRTQGWVITLRWLYVILLSKLFGYVPLQYSRITPQVYVGSQHGLLGKYRLRMAGVTASINLREEFDYAEKWILFEDYLHIPVLDEHAVSLDQLHDGIVFIQQVVNNGGIVYVHCASGVGRSVMLVIAYLIQDGMTFEEAYAKVKTVRPFVYLFPSQQERLHEFEDQLKLSQ